MTTFTMRVAASDYGSQRFAPNSFVSQIGKSIPVNLPDGGTTTGMLESVTISADGSTAELGVFVDGLGFDRLDVTQGLVHSGKVFEAIGQRQLDPGWLTSALKDLYEEYRSIEPWKRG